MLKQNKKFNWAFNAIFILMIINLIFFGIDIIIFYFDQQTNTGLAAIISFCFVILLHQLLKEGWFN